jgi:hypothetical protein
MLADFVEEVLIPGGSKRDATWKEGSLSLSVYFIEKACVRISRHFEMCIQEFQNTFVPPTNIPPLAPLGPSVVLIAGIFLDGMDLVRQKSAAVRSDTYQKQSAPSLGNPRGLGWQSGQAGYLVSYFFFEGKKLELLLCGKSWLLENLGPLLRRTRRWREFRIWGRVCHIAI